MTPPRDVRQALQQFFGFPAFRLGQEEVVARLMSRQSAAAVFPTGSGKSLCYQLPALLLPGLTLVISPLLSLMKDQLDFLAEKKLPAARLDSTLSREQYLNVLDQARTGKLKILMIAVERMANEGFRRQLQRMDLSLLVVDEAHCISEWGHNFRPDYLKIPAYQKQFQIPQALLLTATATPKVLADMCEKFSIAPENAVSTGFYRPNLFLQATPAARNQKKSLLLQRLSEEPGAPTIVYGTLQKTAENLAGFLADNGIPGAPYHAGLGNEIRQEIQDRFMGGQINTVCATIAFGMGVDKADIRRIIHFDMPKSLESYSQEIGRAGRDGQPALCEILAGSDRLGVLENFAYGDTPEPSGIQTVLETLVAQPGNQWELRLNRLALETDIRQLPLKTLLVYLEMEGVLASRMTYYSDYSLQYRRGPEEIVQSFSGERQSFVRAIVDNTPVARVWATPRMDAICAQTGSDRSRVVTALEYFDEKGWVELKSSGMVHVFDILAKDFSPAELARKLFHLFEQKEAAEVDRVHKMKEFIEGERCLSHSLAAYFGQELEGKCGHCSVCATGPAVLAPAAPLPDLDSKDFNELAGSLVRAAEKPVSSTMAARFLCGLTSPRLSRIKATKMPGFGALSAHPFPRVRAWARSHLPG